MGLPRKGRLFLFELLFLEATRILDRDSRLLWSNQLDQCIRYSQSPRGHGPSKPEIFPEKQYNFL